MSSTTLHKTKHWFLQAELFLKDIKIQHSVFALPFAAVSIAVADFALPNLKQAVLLVACMFVGRSFAMGVNRLFDRDVDARNPRTSMRLIAKGELKVRETYVILGLLASLFCLLSFLLNSLCGYLSLPLLLILGSYSKMKRWTWGCHYYLGLCLGLSPIAVQIALSGHATLPVVLVGAAMCFWTAGFDILYALQDIAIDREEGLFSIPSRFGVKRAKTLSLINFIVALLLLFTIGAVAAFNWVYFLGVTLISALLLYQHVLVGFLTSSVPSLKVIGKAFFDTNAWISVVYCSAAFLDRWIAL